MNKIIINGRAGSGKDVVADYLVKKYGYTKLAFADGIKDVAREIFGIKSKERIMLQQIGQKMREIDPDVWVNHVISRADKHDKVVISDCRQANEYEIMTELGYFPIRINSDEDIRVQRILKRDGKMPDVSLLENDSETGADDYPYLELYNDTSLEELYKQVDKLIENRGSTYE